MLNETTQFSEEDAHRMFELVQLFSEPNEASPASANEDFRDVTAYARAIQALRDVRHLLPREGVAIVDKVLDCAP